MLWLRDGHVISISIHSLLSTKPLQASCHCHSHLFYNDLDTNYSYTDLDITSYILTLTFSKEEVLHVL